MNSYKVMILSISHLPIKIDSNPKSITGIKNISPMWKMLSFMDSRKGRNILLGAGSTKPRLSEPGNGVMDSISDATVLA